MSPQTPTKAERLHALAPRLRRSHVPPLLFWTVAEWRAQRAAILATACATFAGRAVAVRSATRHEDEPGSGRAGHYRSELGVAAVPAALASAIDRVIASYRDASGAFDGDAGDDAHQVLVQALVADARRSGVVTTRDLATGAPYFVVELADGRATDAVTAGTARPLRVAIHHDADPALVAAAGLAAVVGATREVESILEADGPLELELIERDDGTIALAQVRAHAAPSPTTAARAAEVAPALGRLTREVEAIARPTPALAGATTILGMMPDWNPAELIGAHPSPLAAALFRALVADATWQEARAGMGYQPVPATPLVHLVAGRPYVDVRASFNSFLPAGLAPQVRTALVDAWLERLRRHPELHDRAELEIAQTTFDFAATRRSPAEDGLGAGARAAWLDALRALTQRAIAGGPRGSLATALRTLATPAPRGGAARPAALPAVLAALARCRDAGARPFAVIARHAFMAEGMLRSLVARGAWSEGRALAFRRALPTVAGRFVADAARVARGAASLRATLVATYGHLRPGAFDVTSLPYARRDPSFWDGMGTTTEPVEPFVPTAAETRAVAGLLAESGLAVDAATLAGWMAAAIAGRDEGKFLFTRRLSAVLEDLAAWGAARDLAREDLACLTLADLCDDDPAERDHVAVLRRRIGAARTRAADERLLRLGPLIRDSADLWVVREPPVLPTFVTDRTIVAPPIAVDGRQSAGTDVAGRIACVESADPGFDWIFGRRVGGLVTRFGGANSHMALRCVELGVPAALGVGEGIFERVRRAALIELRCGERAVRATGAYP